MNPERKEFLSLAMLPGRLNPSETAWQLGFEPHDIPILVSLGLLKPLGRPPASSVKYFASTEIEALKRDAKWLAKASDALRNHWKQKNERAAKNRSRSAPTAGDNRPSVQAQKD
jgi:hypothetical protein